jgi:hypothetical protein
MATRVEMYRAETGRVFERETEALQDDLFALLNCATDSEPIARRVAASITERSAQFAPLIAAIERAKAGDTLPLQFVEAAPTRVRTTVHRFRIVTPTLGDPDEETAIMLHNKRVGYIDKDGGLFAIDAGGKPVYLCDAGEPTDAMASLARWRDTNI